MIILDTNIISEMMKPSPIGKVVVWLDEQITTELFMTTITIAEISYGLHVLPAGNRRNTLEIAFDKATMKAFKHRILVFDEVAANIYGKIMGHRKTLGKPLSIADGQIAAIAHAHNARLATRNTDDFVECGIDLINPFK